MSVNKCTSCFYAKMDKDLESPCITCSGYANWVPRDMYEPEYAEGDAWFVTDTANKGYDLVNKPKHYMLFEKEGIEVRDVIEKLVLKIYNAFYEDKGTILDGKKAPMFDADYVQMMQYLMRFMDKNGVEDLKKAKWYLDKLIEAYESDV